MILDLFFVPIHLMLDPINCQIQSNQQIFVAIFRHKVVFVLGVDEDFYFLERLVLEIDRDLDHGNPGEIVEQFFGLLPDLLLMFFTQMPMSGGDFYLHSREPPRFCGGLVWRRARKKIRRASRVDRNEQWDCSPRTDIDQ